MQVFNIGSGEVMIVLVVAFVIVGPDDLPKVAVWLGRQLRRLRLVLRDIKAETGLDEVEREVTQIQSDVKQTVREMDVAADLRDAAKDVEGEFKGLTRDVNTQTRRLDQALRSETRKVDDELRESIRESDDRRQDD